MQSDTEVAAQWRLNGSPLVSAFVHFLHRFTLCIGPDLYVRRSLCEALSV